VERRTRLGRERTLKAHLARWRQLPTVAKIRLIGCHWLVLLRIARIRPRTHKTFDFIGFYYVLKWWLGAESANFRRACSVIMPDFIGYSS
jgi:hypothetical protein